MAYSQRVLAALAVLSSLPAFSQPPSPEPNEAIGGDAGRPVTNSGRRGRFSLYGANASYGYSSLGESSSGSVMLGNLLADYYAVGSFSTGYDGFSENGSFSLVYTPYYSRRLRRPELSSFGQTLSLAGIRRYHTRGRLSYSLNVTDTTVEQLAAFSSFGSLLTGTPATADEFAQAILGQDQPNARLSTILLEGQNGNPSTLIALFGGRVLTVGTHVGYDWALTTRSRVFVSGDFSRAQPLQSSGPLGETNSYNLRSTGENALAGWSYSLTPRTTIGFVGEYHRSRSGYYNGDVTQGTFTFGRQFRRVWVTSLSAGGGSLTLLPRLDQTTERKSPIWSAAATVGVRGRAHGILANLSRSAGDQYGAGSAGTTIASLAWNWNRPGHTWATTLTGGYQKLERGLLNSFATWSVDARATRALNPNLGLTLAFSYMDTPTQSNAAPLSYNVLSGFQTRAIVQWLNHPER